MGFGGARYGMGSEQLSKLLGRIPSPPDDRDHPLSLYLAQPLSAIALPTYRYPGYSTKFPVYNQVGPSCVGNGSALMASMDQRKDHLHWDTFDGEELYARCKDVDGAPDVDGTYPRVAYKIRQDRGAKVKTSPRTSEVGSFAKISAYARLTSILEIKIAIYLYGAVGLGSTWFDEWFTPDLAGYVPKGQVPAGGHFYDAIGYSDSRKAFLCQNSWDKTWGITFNGTGGRFWLRYEYIDWDDFEAWRSIDKDD